MELSPTNISIDILTALIFLLVCARGIIALYLNHLEIRNKIYIFTFVVAGALYIFQTIMQIPQGVSSSPLIWNIINGIHAFLAISIVTLLSKNRQHE